MSCGAKGRSLFRDGTHRVLQDTKTSGSSAARMPPRCCASRTAERHAPDMLDHEDSSIEIRRQLGNDAAERLDAACRRAENDDIAAKPL